MEQHADVSRTALWCPGRMRAPMVALESPREDLCSAGSPAVDEDDHWLGSELRRLPREHLWKKKGWVKKQTT